MNTITKTLVTEPVEIETRSGAWKVGLYDDDTIELDHTVGAVSEGINRRRIPRYLSLPKLLSEDVP